MIYINKIIYFVAKVWFAFVMLLALILTAVLSFPFVVLEWIDKSPTSTSDMLIRNKLFKLGKISG